MAPKKKLKFPPFSEFIKARMRETGQSEDEVLIDFFNNSGMFEIDETVLGEGYATLDSLGPWEIPQALGIKGEEAPENKKRRVEYRRLREEFAPVSAGIEYHRAFTSGSGFINQISDPNDKHQKLMKKTIDTFCGNVYQDEYNIGLDHLIDILLDAALVEGAGAAEIVYGTTDIKFMNYVSGTKDVVVGTKPDNSKITERRFEVKEPDWKKFKDGITRLKIIDGAIDRLEPVRDTESFEVLYWVLDKNTKDPVFFHTWQILWITWNARGRKLKGFSLVKPVYVAAKLLEQIQYNVGVNFSRWADRKFFFVCGTEKRPWGKIHTANFIRDVKRMKTKNLSALPVPAGFDVKEIGGEVFDGANITDYLLGMISAGMQYPKELIAGAERGESEKAWLAWVVRYGRNQQQLKRSIEHQLFKRHLWSIWGKEQAVHKQGVKPDKRDVIPTFIPKIVWGAEGRWAKETKIKTLKLLGDMANPASPELHLAMQKDMAETLGYGQLDWEDTEEFISLNKEIKVVSAERELLRAKALLKRDKELGEDGLVKKIGEEEKVKQMMLEQAGKEEGEDEASQEERLKKQQKKRLEGGVSRTTKGKKTKKGKAKSLGGGPRKVQETITEKKKPSRLKKMKEENLKTEKEILEDKKKVLEKIKKKLGE